MLTPTAETNPKGSFYGTNYEVVAFQLGYSITDYTQVSVSVIPLIDPQDFVLPADLSIKTVVLREPRVSVAVIASATGVLGFDAFSGFLGRAGGAVSLCIDPAECRVGVSFGSSIALAGPASVWFNGVGMSWRLSRLVGLLAEVDSLLPLGEEAGEANGVLGGFGVRLSGRAWGVDLALMSGGKAGAAPTPVIPFIAATYRRVP